jgi:hypothetical protein
MLYDEHAVGGAMIARIWQGCARLGVGKAYMPNLVQTGLKQYQESKGFKDIFVLTREIEDKTEYLLITYGKHGGRAPFCGTDCCAVAAPRDSIFGNDFREQVRDMGWWDNFLELTRRRARTVCRCFAGRSFSCMQKIAVTDRERVD